MKPRETQATEPKRHEKRVIDTMAENLAAEAAEAKAQEQAATQQEERFHTSLVTNRALWNEFSAINKKMSVTNNSAINMLIARFVQENKQYLSK